MTKYSGASEHRNVPPDSVRKTFMKRVEVDLENLVGLTK